MAGEGLKPNAVVGDRYRLVRSLGEGGMGWVWEATHVFTHKHVAIKFLKSGKEVDRRRFQREVRAAAAVRHPNVIDVHDFIELPDGTLAMAMDLLEGETLGTVLERKGTIALADLAAVLLPVLSALEATHAVGIVHRDLKPHNVFLSRAKGKIEVKVLDFGVAKLTAAEGLAARTQALTGTGSMVGTPYYMSPEQVVSEKDLDGRADVWSLGVLMYECLTGARPTEADNVGRVLKRILVADFEPIEKKRDDLPEDIVALVGRMLSAERDKRPKDVKEVREVLQPHAADEIPDFSGGDETATQKASIVVDATARSAAETRHAVSVAAAPPRARSRYVAVGAMVLAAVAGVAVVRGWGFANSAPPAVTPPANAQPAEPPPSSIASANPQVSAAVSVAEPRPPELALSAAASATGSATSSKPVRNTSTPTARPVASAKPAVSVSAPVATPAASAPPVTSTPKPPLGLAASPKD